MDVNTQAIRAFGWSLSDKLINQLGHLALTIYIARLIGPESFGFIGILTVFMLLADGVISGGFTNALIQRSQQLTEEDASTVFWINLAWGIFIYLTLYMTAPLIANFYHQLELIEISRVLFLIIIINSFAVVARAKLMINLDFKSQAIANTYATFFSSIIAVFMINYGYNYWALVWLMVSKALVCSLFICWYGRWVPQWAFSRNSFELLFGFGSKLMLAGFVATLVSNLYVVIIGRYFNVAQVGYFTQATNLSNYLSQFISSTLQGVTYPIMTSMKEDQENLIKTYKHSISITLLISLPIMLGFSAIANDVVVLFLGDKWLPTAPLLVALCIARTVTPISTINMNILNAIGRSDLFLKVDLSKLPLILGSIFIALPYGVEGLGWVIILTSYISFFINAWFPGRIFGYGGLAQLRDAIPYIIASAFMSIIVSVIPLDASIINLFIKVISGALIYTITLLAMREYWVNKLFNNLKN